MKENRKSGSIQALRAIAFFEIFLRHCYVPYFTGAFGVSIFFVLSGFCMELSYFRKPIQDISIKGSFAFALKKISKIYMLHILMMLASALLSGFKISLTSLLLNVFLVQAWVPDGNVYYSLNGVSWYLSAYMFICLAAPLLLYLINKMKNKRSVYLLMAATASVMLLTGWFVSNSSFDLFNDDIAKWFTYICPLYRLGDFILGVCLAMIYNRRDEKTGVHAKIYTAAEIFAIILSVAAMYLHTDRISNQGLRYTILFVPVSLFVVYLFAVNKGMITKLLTNKVLVFIGNISAYTFLIHNIAIRCVNFALSRFHLQDMMILKIICAMAITIASAVLYIKVEAFFKKKFKRNQIGTNA